MIPPELPEADVNQDQKLPTPPPTFLKAKAMLSTLPNELLLQIFSSLSIYDLVRISEVNQQLNNLSSTPSLWASLVSHFRLSSPAPYASFKELISSLHHHLWLHPRIWHSDGPFGQVLISRYTDGAITLHSLLAPRPNTRIRHWSHDSSVIIPSFAPSVALLNPPVLALSAATPPNQIGDIPIDEGGSRTTTLLRSYAIPLKHQRPDMSLWPPPTLPEHDRAREVSPRTIGVRPSTAPSTTLFRLRRELRFYPPSEVSTLSALHNDWFTPTQNHPLRGLWVGDYSSHGCEFVILLQPSGTPRQLQAVKLTGDMNVPRGEYTFLVKDLDAVSRVATEREWPGAKVIKARAQIADNHFQNSQFIDAEFIWISNDEFAMHWKFPREMALGQGLINRFRRIDTDLFLFGAGEQKFSDNHRRREEAATA